jgi:hypothetical protein
MSKGVTGPLLITGLVVAVGNGWILAAWNAIYTWTHTGGSGSLLPTNPLSKSGALGATPFVNPITHTPVGTGTYNGQPQDIIPNNPETNPSFS